MNCDWGRDQLQLLANCTCSGWQQGLGPSQASSLSGNLPPTRGRLFADIVAFAQRLAAGGVGQCTTTDLPSQVAAGVALLLAQRLAARSVGLHMLPLSLLCLLQVVVTTRGSVMCPALQSVCTAR